MAVIDLADRWEALPDASLVDEARAGRLDAFTELYERHHGAIFRLCRGRLGNDHDAADAAQDTFLRAWRALETFGGERRVGPWLRTIASNVCIDVLRTRGRAVPVATIDLVAEESAPDLRPDTAAVTAALARLSDRHREILQLREYQGWSYERIAEQQQLDLNAVKSLLWRARQSLRREFLLLSGQGRLSALGGLLFVRPVLRLRNLLSEASSAVGHAGVAGGTAATAMAMTATVALPVLGPAPTLVAPAPAIVEVAVEAAPAIVLPAVRASLASPASDLAPVSVSVPAPVPVPAAIPATAPVAHEAPPVEPSRSTPTPRARAEARPAVEPAVEPPGQEVREERASERDAAADERAEVKAERGVERAAAADARAEVKAEAKAGRETAGPTPQRAAPGPPEHAGGPPADRPADRPGPPAEPHVAVGPPAQSAGRNDAPGPPSGRPERGRPEDPGS